MIKVSIEVTELFQERLKPIVDLRQRFLQNGILVGFDLKSADLRILHHNVAMNELAASSHGRLRTPVIVYERIDSAVIHNDPQVRSLLASEDVKLWLKLNSLRNHNLNNEPFLGGAYHYRVLNEFPDLHIDGLEQACTLPVTPEMTAKIRLLPIVPTDLLAGFRETVINWSEKRPIDVSFAGLVDYEVRGTDYWDGKLAEALAIAPWDAAALVNNHRRAAVLQLGKLRHLRVLIGINRALQPDLYLAAMLRSSISISPWGF